MTAESDLYSMILRIIKRFYCAALLRRDWFTAHFLTHRRTDNGNINGDANMKGKKLCLSRSCAKNYRPIVQQRDDLASPRDDPP